MGKLSKIAESKNRIDLDYQNPELVAAEWVESAEQDLVVADSLFTDGHYAWAMFACQQALEKLLKAGYVNSRHKIPPHLHKLERLASIIKINPPEEHIDNLLEINQCYTSTRYPGYRRNLCAQTKEEAEEILYKTRKTFSWLKQTLRL
ncbi:MAG: HEPN domain-containing protein [Actinomycetota bacterium]